MKDLSEVSRLIHTVHGRRVMLDSDLAALYGVKTKALNLAVKRNSDRFPDDFSFTLTRPESANLRFQIETSSFSHGGRRYSVRVFTEHGVAMLSSVLRSRRATEVNIAIIRAFVKLRELAAQNRLILAKLSELERRVGRTETDIGAIIDAIRREAEPPPEEPGRRIGFDPKRKET